MPTASTDHCPLTFQEKTELFCKHLFFNKWEIELQSFFLWWALIIQVHTMHRFLKWHPSILGKIGKIDSGVQFLHEEILPVLFFFYLLKWEGRRDYLMIQCKYVSQTDKLSDLHIKTTVLADVSNIWRILTKGIFLLCLNICAVWCGWTVTPEPLAYLFMLMLKLSSTFNFPSLHISSFAHVFGCLLSAKWLAQWSLIPDCGF